MIGQSIVPRILYYLLLSLSTVPPNRALLCLSKSKIYPVTIRTNKKVHVLSFTDLQGRMGLRQPTASCLRPIDAPTGPVNEKDRSGYCTLLSWSTVQPKRVLLCAGNNSADWRRAVQHQRRRSSPPARCKDQGDAESSRSFQSRFDGRASRRRVVVVSW
jgi:hypothetical protein